MGNNNNLMEIFIQPMQLFYDLVAAMQDSHQRQLNKTLTAGGNKGDVSNLFLP